MWVQYGTNQLLPQLLLLASRVESVIDIDTNYWLKIVVLTFALKATAAPLLRVV